MYSCVHTHTKFCDGKNTAAEMAAAAYEQNIKVLGFSGHSYVSFDGFGMKDTQLVEYLAEISRLKLEYKDKMQVLAGCELDSLSDLNYGDGEFDYIIGSSHFVTDSNGMSYPVDCKPEKLLNGRDNGFGGDMRAMTVAYFEQFLEFLVKAKPDIVGHFDLITKHNKDGSLFDSNAVWYKNTVIDAIDCILEQGMTLEMNLGRYARGYGKIPYPDVPLLEYLKEKQAKLIVTTDSHSVDALTLYVDEAIQLLKSLGYKTVVEMTNVGLVERYI